MIRKIFIDLDGVLADFFSAGFRLFDRDPASMPCNFNGWLPNVLGCTEKEFWSRIDEDYWINLEKLPDADRIVEMVRSFVPDPSFVGILTSPGNDPRACSGKKAWVNKHFPNLAKNTFIGSRKELLAHPGAVLLDDWSKNVILWRGNGGEGVLVPRRWNEDHELDTLSTLKSRLTEIKQNRHWILPSSGAKEK